MGIFSQNLCFVQSYLIIFCHKKYIIGSYLFGYYIPNCQIFLATVLYL